MALNEPLPFDFPTHYGDDGLYSWTMELTYEATGDPIDLTDAVVRMQLRTRYTGKLAWEFSSDGEGNSLIEIIDPANGVIEFPEIKSWDIPASTYDYDLEIKDDTGFYKTYLRGTWAVRQDITTKQK